MYIFNGFARRERFCSSHSVEKRWEKYLTQDSKVYWLNRKRVEEEKQMVLLLSECYSAWLYSTTFDFLDSCRLTLSLLCHHSLPLYLLLLSHPRRFIFLASVPSSSSSRGLWMDEDYVRPYVYPFSCLLFIHLVRRSSTNCSLLHVALYTCYLNHFYLTGGSRHSTRGGTSIQTFGYSRIG